MDMNELMKYSYLLDRENIIYSNKIFIDLMYHICKINNMNTKCYVIRTAGMMLQDIFNWQFMYLKNGRMTTYKYNNNGKIENTIKRDLNDWWDTLRLSQREITSGNKLLTQKIELKNISEYKEKEWNKELNTNFEANCPYSYFNLKNQFKKDTVNLITIVKMRIKQKDTNIFKPCNCYILNWDVFGIFLDDLTNIVSNVYKEKIDNYMQHNIKTSKISKAKKVKPKILPVTTETAVTLKNKALKSIKNELSTEFTLSTSDNIPVTTETAVTKATTETAVTKATTETAVTNKSELTYTNTTLQKEKPDSFLPNLNEEKNFNKINNKVLKYLRKNISDVSYKTWIYNTVGNAKLEKDNILIPCSNELVQQVLNEKYKDQIINAYKSLNLNYNLKFYI